MRGRVGLWSAVVAILAALVVASSAAAAAPTVTIDQAVGQIDPTPGSTIQFTATFSAPVTGFNEADVALAGAGATTVTVTGSGAVYTVSVSGMTVPGAVEVSIPANAAQNAAHEDNLASTSTDNSVTWYSDTTPPTVTIDAAAAQADPASGAAIFFTARFSEPVVGFDATDVALAGSSAGGPLVATVSGGPTDYDIAVSGMTSAGTVVATIPAGAALDLAGNPSLASTSSHNSVSWMPTIPNESGGGAGGGGSGTGTGTGGNGGGGGATTMPLPPKPSLRLLLPCSAKHPCIVAEGAQVLLLRVACGPAAPCAGKLLIAAGHKTLGKLDFSLAAGTTKKLTMTLLHRAARLLAARPEISARLEIRLGGHSTSRSLHLSLPRAHPPL